MTLQERIARLNLGGSSSSNSGQTPMATGAQGKIGDKIKKFQENAEDQPLLPEGPFGLGGVRKPSSSAAGSAGDKSRVVSLGGGRATVPIDTVKGSRSVSAGYAGLPSTTQASSSASPSQTPGLSRSSSTHGTSAEAAFVADASDAQSRTSIEDQSSSRVPPAIAVPSKEDRPDLFLSTGPKTPSARSVSSMDVEEGSYTSEKGPDPDSISIDVNPQASPLSSPVLTALVSATPPASEGSIPLLSAPPGLASLSKGPLGALKVPVRSSPSSVSVSSLAVEVGDETATEHTASESGVGTPKEDATLDLTTDADGHREEVVMSEADRISRTNAELANYENEALDMTAPPVVPRGSDEAHLGTSQAPEQPIIPTWVTEDSAPPMTAEDKNGTEGYGDIIDEMADEPKIKCSDCAVELVMEELADHVCAKPSTPIIRSSEPESQSASATGETCLTDTVEPSATPTPSSPAPIPGESPLQDSPVEAPPSASNNDKLDAFVPQTESLVPEDVLDLYNDDDEENDQGRLTHRQASLPQDVDVDEVDAHGVESSRLGQDLPQDVPNDSLEVEDEVRPTDMRRIAGANGDRRVKSVYEAPGKSLFDESEDDDGYDGGSVAIVSRTVASHAPSSSAMTRQSTA
ncbi:hypothetical protein OIO90_000202 [Microbotryomycetes sp. JL221]|nr:hypothetical protein OIO90_000202 [Microbotryomycetes sp. JL221]